MLCIACGILSVQSSRGEIWDKEENLHRGWVVPLLKVLLVLGVFEVVIFITTMGLLIDALFVSCHKYDDLHDALSINVGEIKNFFKMSSEVVLGSGKVTSRKVYQGVLGLLLFQLIFLILYYLYMVSKVAGCRNLCCSFTSLCCICVPKAKKNPMAEVGELLNDLFPKDSLLTSDIVAGMTSLYATSKIMQEKDRDQRVLKGVINVFFYFVSI